MFAEAFESKHLLSHKMNRSCIDMVQVDRKTGKERLKEMRRGPGTIVCRELIQMLTDNWWNTGPTSIPIVGGSSIHAGVVDIDVQLTVDQQVIAFENHEIAESACPLVEVPTLWRTRYKPCLTAKLLQNVYHNVLFYY